MADIALEPVSIEPPFSISRPVVRQTWSDLTFLHWAIAPEAVRPLLPEGLELDLWDGRAYVGLVPFLMSEITLAKAPPVPWLSRFPETNVRTYVYDRHGRRGVWFFSLDAARLAAVIAARVSLSLPYFWAKMAVEREGNSVSYRSRRRHGPAGHSKIVISPGAEIDEPSALEAFLTARWRLFSWHWGRLITVEVEHPPWPLRKARVDWLEESLLVADGLPSPQGDPLVHFATEVTVMTGMPKRV